MTSWPEWANDWTPPVEVRSATISPQAVAGLAALLDAEAATHAVGAPLPLLWHWVALAEWAPMTATGLDGHPSTGDVMPPTPYARRMWLGTTVEVATTPRIGDPVTVERSVTDIIEKAGSSGPFALVTVATTIRSPDSKVLLGESTQFAYRGSPLESDVAGPPAWPGPSEVEAQWLKPVHDQWVVRPNPVVLARYSALTANGHRIHYDVPYATRVEGYPNLLVHGPLMATVLAEFGRRNNHQHELTSFSCRALSPLFLGTSAVVSRSTGSRPDRIDLEVSSESPTGEPTIHMTASLSAR